MKKTREQSEGISTAIISGIIGTIIGLNVKEKREQKQSEWLFPAIITGIIGIVLLIPIMGLVAGMKAGSDDSVFCVYDFRNKITINKKDRCFYMYSQLEKTSQENSESLIVENQEEKRRGKDIGKLLCPHKHFNLMSISEGDKCIDTYIELTKREIISDQKILLWLKNNPDQDIENYSFVENINSKVQEPSNNEAMEVLKSRGLIK